MPATAESPIDLDPIRDELDAPDPVDTYEAYARLSLVSSREVNKFKTVFFDQDVAVATNGYMIGALAIDSEYTGFLPADPFIPDETDDKIDWMNPASVSIDDGRMVNPLAATNGDIDIDEDESTVSVETDNGLVASFDIPDIEPTQFGNAFASREDRDSKSFMVNIRMMHRVLMALAPGQEDLSSVAALDFDRRANKEKPPLKIFTRNGVGIFMPLSLDKGEEIVNKGDDDDGDSDAE